MSPIQLAGLRADLVAMVPGLRSVSVSADGEGLRIDFLQIDGESVPASLVSDGTLRILGLLTLLHLEHTYRASVILVEEPENGVFPGRLLALTEHLRVAATRGPRDNRSVGEVMVAEHERVTLFVLHADGGNDPERCHRERIAPAIDIARAANADTIVAACLPVREIEAWLLADPEVFKQALGLSEAPALPLDPEADLDPKLTFKALTRSSSLRGQGSIYGVFGNEISIDALRGLPSFRSFESALEASIDQLCTFQGVR